MLPAEVFHFAQTEFGQSRSFKCSCPLGTPARETYPSHKTEAKRPSLFDYEPFGLVHQ
jgi:hypothetical protein